MTLGIPVYKGKPLIPIYRSYLWTKSINEENTRNKKGIRPFYLLQRVFSLWINGETQMRLSDEAIRRIIQEEFQDVLRERCMTTQVDRQIVHKGSGAQKKSYIQVKITKLCDDAVTTPTERAEKDKEIERKKKALQKKQAQRGKEWRRDKDKQKKQLSRPDQSG